MPMRGVAPQAVVLASDTGSRLHPLNGDGVPKALLPVGNRPLLSYPLAMIEGSSVRHVLLVRPPRLKFLPTCQANMSPGRDQCAVTMWERLMHSSPSQSRSSLDGTAVSLQRRLDRIFACGPRPDALRVYLYSSGTSLGVCWTGSASDAHPAGCTHPAECACSGGCTRRVPGECPTAAVPSPDLCILQQYSAADLPLMIRSTFHELMAEQPWLGTCRPVAVGHGEINCTGATAFLQFSSGLRHRAQVCSGKQTAERVESWIDASYAGDLHLEVRGATAALPCLHAKGRIAAMQRL